MKPEIQNRNIGVVGRKGAGKSHWVTERLAYSPRVAIFDVLDEYANVPNRTESLKHLEQMLRQSKEQATFACRYMPIGELEDEIERVAALVYDREKGRVPENLRGVCFVCEEIALYTHPGYVPPVLGKLVRTGRHRRIDLVWATQRPAECSKTITGQTDLWVLFQLTEPRDLSAIADRCGSEVASRVADLKEHEHFVWDARTRETVEDSPRLLKR